MKNSFMNLGPEGLLESLRSNRRVEGLTHNFYNYPARFSPQLARDVILEFSREQDCVVDPFMGGGTTIVEAIANGRKAVGIDINPLSHFITEVKTRPLSQRDREEVMAWAHHFKALQSSDWPFPVGDPRLKNMPEEVVQVLGEAVSSLGQLEFRRQRRFARCALLRLGQWAVDCRKDYESVTSMRMSLSKQVTKMLMGLEELNEAVSQRGIPKNKITGARMLYLGQSEKLLQGVNLGGSYPRPRLVLTSPPYPGVHVLYHRWQIRGRRETPAPYWLADLRDGHWESYYTLGSRTPLGLRNYFRRIREIFGLLRELVDPNATVVQLVAFSDPETQVPPYLDAMKVAGYEEFMPFGNGRERPARKVPNRKWYVQAEGDNHASNEILLFHRPCKRDTLQSRT